MVLEVRDIQQGFGAKSKLLMMPPKIATVRPDVVSMIIAAMISMTACTFELSPPTVTPDAAQDAGTSDVAAEVDLPDAEADAVDATDDAVETGPSCVVLNAAEPSPLGPFTMTSSVAPTIGGVFESDDLLVHLRENTKEQGAGVFDLADGNDTNYATCDHCLLLREDLDAMGVPAKTYYPRSGTVKVTAVQSPPTPSFAMSLEDVEFVEVTIEPKTDLSVLVQGGGCFRITSAEWDTTDRDDGDCASESSCIDCCNAYHPGSYESAGEVLRSCVCAQVACEAECADNYCAEPASGFGVHRLSLHQCLRIVRCHCVGRV